MKKLIFILTFLIIIGLVFNAAAFELKIAKEVEVNTAQITLDEIAELHAPELNAAEVEKLKKLKFKTSPNPGYSKRLSRVLVDLTIQNQGYAKEEFRLEMPDTVIVNRKSTIIEEKEIATLVKDYIKNNLNFKEAELIIESRNSARKFEISAGDYQLKIAKNQNLSLPNTNLKIEVWQNGEKQRNIFYPVKINLLLEVLTAAKNLAGNNKITKEDFKLKEKKISGNPEGLIKDWAEIDLNNLKLSRSLAQGEVLRKDYLKAPYVVQWGKKLNLRVKVNNINISTFVEAKERGKIGETITVENLNSGYQFQVKVVSPTEVQMISD